MFAEDGTWKEFGLIANPKYTWFPFWLFCIVWALVSFTVSRFIIGASEERVSPTKPFSLQQQSLPPPRNNLKPGYYVLNREASEIEGVPRYVYIGAEEPSE